MEAFLTYGGVGRVFCDWFEIDWLFSNVMSCRNGDILLEKLVVRTACFVSILPLPRRWRTNSSPTTPNFLLRSLIRFLDAIVDTLISSSMVDSFLWQGYLTNNGIINLDRVEKIMRRIGILEDEIFKKRRQSDLNYRAREVMMFTRFA